MEGKTLVTEGRIYGKSCGRKDLLHSGTGKKASMAEVEWGGKELWEAAIKAVTEGTHIDPYTFCFCEVEITT